MNTANGPQPAAEESTAPTPDVDDAAPATGGSPHDAATSRLRRLGRVWLMVALAEAVLYFLLYRSDSLSDLYPTPALIVLAAGAYGTWHALRPRSHRDRRHGGRRRSDGRR